jgi:hypothetical protein
MTELIPGGDADDFTPSCPPEYAHLSGPELIAAIESERQRRAAAAAGEILAAGFRARTPSSPSRAGTGFESGGVLDVGAPSGSLAGLAESASRDGRLADLDDDELIGLLRVWQRLESWCASGLLKAIAELARRRPADRTPAAPSGEFPAQLSEFLGDEIAAALTLTGRAADTRLSLSLDLEIRLPGTAQALHEGVITNAKAQLIAEATRILSDDDASAVEAWILSRAGQQTTGQLRAAVARAVLAIDPTAAERRREEAQKDPRVRRWQEDAGTAALAGYGLPPADVLVADQRITTRARALRDAGLSGSLEELRARAYLDALLGQDSIPLAEPDQPPAPGPSHGPGPAGPPVTPGSGGGGLAARVNLTVPLLTQLGRTAEPGAVGGFGPVDPALSRELVTRAAAHPASRFCLTLIGADGHAIGHGCLPGRLAELTRPGSPGLTVTIRPIANGTCEHGHQESRYEPSRRLQHLIWARGTTCSAPGCRQPAARCDLDHTVPYDQGGRTCECNLAPLCRHHHRCKQAEGWRLEQPRPGVMAWTTPAGRRYVTVARAG